MTTWLYAAAETIASQSATLWLAYESGFVWRSFYNAKGHPIPCVQQIVPGDDLVLAYRRGGEVEFLARFRVGRPDKPIAASPCFGQISAVWIDEFRCHGYRPDPKLGVLVGIFVEDGEPLGGRASYSARNALSRMEMRAPTPVALAVFPKSAPAAAPRSMSLAPDPGLPVPARARDGIHVGIDVGGRPEKGFDLCITEWRDGLLETVRWKRVPHASPLPPTSTLRGLVRGTLAEFATKTAEPAIATAGTLWRELQPIGAAGIHIDSPSGFSRNQLRHGRYCEKVSLRGVSFQSTPSIACGRDHGGDWGWLVYGMIAYSAVVHRGELTNALWMADLQNGTFGHSDSKIVLRECFPTATISVLRTRRREADVGRSLARHADRPEIEAVIRYLAHGVKEIKRPRNGLYDRADALVAAMGALPHVAQGFREVWGGTPPADRWRGAAGDAEREGSFACIA